MANGTVHTLTLEHERTRRRMLRESELMFKSLETLCEALELMATYPPYRYLQSIAIASAQLKADLYSDHTNGGLSHQQLAMAADILAGLKATLHSASKHVVT